MAALREGNNHSFNKISSSTTRLPIPRLRHKLRISMGTRCSSSSNNLFNNSQQRIRALDYSPIWHLTHKIWAIKRSSLLQTNPKITISGRQMWYLVAVVNLNKTSTYLALVTLKMLSPTMTGLTKTNLQTTLEAATTPSIQLNLLSKVALPHKFPLLSISLLD